MHARNVTRWQRDFLNGNSSVTYQVLSSAIQLPHLDYYLEEFARHAEQNGVIVHWAKDAKEHNEIVYDILQKHHVKKLVKSKSMLTEECRLNDFCFQRYRCCGNRLD